jgi:hypothetical protein
MNSGKNKHNQKYTGDPIDLERTLVVHISNTGKEQIKKRRKAGLSVYYLKDGRIVEVKPDRTEIQGKQIESRWVTLEKKKRSFLLK